MSDDEKTLAKLEERSASHADRLKGLEDNQKWGVLTILALIAKAVFEYFASGGK